jgi:outer membrane cobalamin receptor
MRLLLLILILFLPLNLIYSQNGGSISGRVLDENANAPIEYANVVLFSLPDSSQITGTVTNSGGFFEINNVRPGRYYVDILFMGYERQQVDEVVINENNNSINLGEIKISAASVLIDDVVVESRRPSLSYQIDKKVIDVDQFSTSISGNAAEVLENIPSITVDIEGNVSLRGSSNFTVLIDGRPTVLDAQDVLQQIPASTIANIEIITNPSAKYNPEGTAGIINIIMKQNRNLGLSGMVNLNAGLREKYGGDFLFEYKTTSINTVFGIDYNNRFFGGNSSEENRYFYQGNTSYINSAGDSKRGRISLGLRGSVEFILSQNDFFKIGGRYGNRDNRNNSNSIYNEWTALNPQTLERINIGNRYRSGDFYQINLSYFRKFDAKGHELSGDISFENQNSDEMTLTELYNNGQLLSGRRTTEAGPSKEFNARFDYVLPIGENNRFEAGYEGEIEISDETTGLYDYNQQTGVYDFLTQYYKDVRYDENEHAAYSIFSGSVNDFGYQAGLRSELTKRIIFLETTSEEYKVDRVDFFPTIHSSYKFPGGQQVMASYTRRLNRPRGWALEPFETWTDANNVRIGNPSLIPEFIDNYEIAAQTFVGNVSISAEVYYAATHNKIEGIRSVYSENVTLRSFDNVGKDFSLGSEFLINFDVAKVWNVNLMGNMYEYKIEGIIFDEPFTRSSFNWRTRINNVVKLGENTSFQINGVYNSPSVSSQGRREGFFTSDLAIRQDLMDKQLSITLQMRDILNTAKHEFVSQGTDFYTYNQYTRESPMLMLNVRYSINNFRQERERSPGEEGFSNDEEF